MISVIDAIVVVGLLFLVLNGAIWFGYSLLGLIRDSPPRKWGAEDIQLRIIARGEPITEIHKTIESLPEDIADVRVVSTEEIDIDGVVVHVVPEEFECESRPGKGRIYEWARRNIDTDAEYVGYVTAGMRIEGFTGLPDVDFVELITKPVQPEGGSRLVYLSKLLQMNGPVEARGYALSEAPVFVSTTGIFIRSNVEQEITWNRTAINIASAFAWHATAAGYTYKYITDTTSKPCESNINQVIDGKRHLYSGRVHDSIAYLSLPKWLFNSFRSTSWAVGTFTTPLIIAGFFLSPLAQTLALMATGIVIIQSFFGWKYSSTSKTELVQMLIVLPVITIFDGIGYLYGMFNPVEEYSVSETGAEQADISKNA